MTAPIVLFVFARPDHTCHTLTALAANELAQESDLIVFADGARNDAEWAKVRKVRELVRGVHGFRSVTLIERMENYGLARNIIEGVTEVCSQRGRAIVMEDDIVTSPCFLKFMNQALDRYLNDKRVWHISGWNYPIDVAGMDEAFFWRVMNCWGWATWADRWQHFHKSPADIVCRWSFAQRRRFNLDGAHSFFSQVLGNYLGKNRTWAIFWYATLYERQGLCLNPAASYVTNSGCDGTGTHEYKGADYATVLNYQFPMKWPELVVENQLAVTRIKQFYQASTTLRQRGKSWLIQCSPVWVFKLWRALRQMSGRTRG